MNYFGNIKYLSKRFVTYTLLTAGLSVFAISCGNNGHSANNAANNSADNTQSSNQNNSQSGSQYGNTAPGLNSGSNQAAGTSMAEDNTLEPTGTASETAAGGNATPAELAKSDCREAEKTENGQKDTAKGSRKVKAKRLKAVVTEKFPHDKYAYTQGLFFENGALYESCGQYGTSNLRTVDITTGKVLSKSNLDSKYFAEGSVIFGGNLYLLTWREQLCMVYNPATFKKIGEIRYNGEGWGLTTDGKELIMSNGSSSITFLDPMTFMESRRINVTLDGKPVDYVNELEYINGEIWANVYLEDYIITIDPQTGCVTSVIDCTNVYPTAVRSAHADVLNGIAYNPADGGIYITGKYWPQLYKISVSE